MTGSDKVTGRRLAPAALQLFALRGGEFHHLGPLVGVAPPELAEFHRVHDDRPPAHLGQARRDARIGEAGVDLTVTIAAGVPAGTPMPVQPLTS